jgi:hypothetical protein
MNVHAIGGTGVRWPYCNIRCEDGPEQAREHVLNMCSFLNPKFRPLRAWNVFFLMSFSTRQATNQMEGVHNVA